MANQQDLINALITSARRERNDPRPGNPADSMQDLKDHGQYLSDYQQASDPTSNDMMNSPWGGGRGPTPLNLSNAQWNVRNGGDFYKGLGNNLPQIPPSLGGQSMSPQQMLQNQMMVPNQQVSPQLAQAAAIPVNQGDLTNVMQRYMAGGGR